MMKRNRKNGIERDCKADLYFYIETTMGKIRGIKAKRTINEWEHLIYKPEENSMVVENEDENHVIYDGVHGELPVWRYFELEENHLNKYEVDGDIVYNEKDKKFYYEIELENRGMHSTIADISTNSSELKFNINNLKVELPKHTRNTYSQVKVYIPLKDNLEEKNYDLPIIKKYVDGSEENWREDIILHDGYEHCKEVLKGLFSDELSQDEVTVKYTIDDYSGRFSYNAFGKKYTLPCEAYQKEDGTWTSDAVDNFEKYVDQVVEKVDVKGFVNTQDFDNTANSFRKNVIYVIGFIALVGIILLIKFVFRIIKTKQDEDF